MELNENEQILNVAPGLLVGDENSRFGLKPSRISSLMEAILADGGIQVPLRVHKLETPVNGAQYRIDDGHYRHAAATKLLKEYEILCPIQIVEGESDPIKRLKIQTSINYEREGLSPMDIAVAIKTLNDAGVPRAEILNTFKKAGVAGRSAGKVQALSNSMMNIYLAFLEFPKDIQRKIHEGVIGVGAAYKLTTKPRDKWEEIVASCEQEREAEIAADVDRETRYLETIKKEEERHAKEIELGKEVEKARETLKLAAAILDQKVEAEGAATMAARKATEKDAKEKAAADLAAAKEASTEAQKAAEVAKKESEKLQAKLDKVKEQATERAKKLAEARIAAANKAPKGEKADKPIGAGAIDKAAAKAGGSAYTPLKAVEMRKAVSEWALPGSFPIVSTVMQVVMRCFDGELTPNQAYTELGKATGEKTSKKK